MVLTCLNRSRFCSVCSRNVASTTKPRRAIFDAGFSALRRLSVPQRSRACSQVAGVPGTPTLAPLVTRSGVNGYGSPVAGSMNTSRGIDRGAVSRPSIVDTLPVLAS